MTGAPPHRQLSRPARLTLGCLGAAAIVGLAGTALALFRSDVVPRVPPRLLAAAPFVVVATVGNLLVRFVRWQYLLRRAGVRLPTIPALGAFVGSFAFLPVPLYAGQLVARVRLLGVPPADVRRVVLAFGWERALDVWALAALATPACSPPVAVTLLAGVALAMVPPVARVVGRVLHAGASYVASLLAAEPGRAETPEPALPVGLGVAALLSLVAWGLVVVSALGPLVWLFGAHVPIIAGAAVAARSILLGAVSLIPLGATVAGTALFDGLQALGASALEAAPVVFVFRVGTVWLSLVLGGVALVALGRDRAGAAGHDHDHDHFDAIDACYDTWLPLHYRDHLVARKTESVLARLPALGERPRGLDIGCGRGWYAARLRAAGAAMTGLDMSARQLVAAREHLGAGVPLAQGSALALPFATGVFDFAYVVNVLHHVATPPEQTAAIVEIGRVVRPGGFVFVHEMSVRNPLFRFYLGYVFPILKGIEEGTEYYLDPRRMTDVPGLRLVDVRSFTFVPDFVPATLLPATIRLERALEASPLAPLAAHFVAVYERVPRA